MTDEINITQKTVAPTPAPAPRNAKRFEAAVVWQSTTDPNKYQFPGSVTDICPAGYRPITLDSIRAMEQFTKKFNELERLRLAEERGYQQLFFDKMIRERRAAALEKMWHNPRAIALLRACAAYVDKKRERKYAQKIEPNFHLQALEFDASNRPAYNGPDTDWKDKKA